MTPTYHPIAMKQLTYATPIIEKKVIYDTFENEYDYRLI